MNIKELKSTTLKKQIGASRVNFQWHNKNNSGGNFGINIYDFAGNNFQLSGYYNTEGRIRNLRFGLMYKSGQIINVDTFEELIYFLKCFK